MEMASIVYTPSINELERRFLALLEMAIPRKRFEVCYSIGELSTRLGMPLSNVKVAVFFAVTQTEITRILSLGDLMANVKSILVLSDEDKDTMIKAHTLRPRYVTWIDCDLIDVVTVTKRMVDLYDAPQGSTRKLQADVRT
ncbi:MAG: hypothetical protein M1418_03445 [Deltaproteobacteria bacterium]|nr:hypothetical protein [Deltaproteobacteria bacterium]